MRIASPWGSLPDCQLWDHCSGHRLRGHPAVITAVFGCVQCRYISLGLLQGQLVRGINDTVAIGVRALLPGQTEVVDIVLPPQPRNARVPTAVSSSTVIFIFDMISSFARMYDYVDNRQMCVKCAVNVFF